MDKNRDIPEELYFHGEEIENFFHVQIPLALVKDKAFGGVSDSAKILYGLLLNRTSLSIRNGWMDKNNRTYIHYTIDDVMEDMNIGKTKAKKIFAELVNISDTGIGLIDKVRVLNKPSRIYVLNFMKVCNYLKTANENNKPDLKDADNESCKKCGPPSASNATHGEPQTRPTVGFKCDPPWASNATPNYINISNTNISDIDISQSIYSDQFTGGSQMNEGLNEDQPKNDICETDIYALPDYSDQQLREVLTYHHFQEECRLFHFTQMESKKRATAELKVLIDYMALKKDPKINIELVDVLVDYMTDIIVFKEPVTIRGVIYEADTLGNRFFSLDMFTIQYVLNKIETTTCRNKISNVKKYYIKCLISARSDMQAGIHGEVNYDLANWNEGD